eukprot:gene12335-6008_t
MEVEDAKKSFFELYEKNARAPMYGDIPEELKQDKQVLIFFVSKSPNALTFIPQSFKEDREIAMSSINSSGFNLIQHNLKLKLHPMYHASQELKNDKNFALELINFSAEVFCFLSTDLRNDQEIAHQVILQNGTLIEFASENIQNDKEIASEAVLQNPDSYQFLSNELKGDFDIISIVVQKNPSIIKNMNIKNTEEALLLIEKNQACFDFMSEKIKNNFDLNKDLMKLYPEMYPNLSIDIRNNYNITFEIVSKIGKFLGSASDEMRQNEEIVFSALKQNLSCYVFAHPKLKSSKVFSLKILKHFPNFNIALFPMEIKDNYDVMTEAVMINGKNYQFISKRLRNDKNLLYQVLKPGFNGFYFASMELKADYDVVLKVVKICPQAIYYVNKRFKYDKTVVLEVVKNYGEYIADCWNTNLIKDREICLCALKSSPSSFRHFSSEIQKEKELAKLAIELYPKNIQYAPMKMRNEKLMKKLLEKDGDIFELLEVDQKMDKEFAKIAIKTSPTTIRHLIGNLRFDEDLIKLAIDQSTGSIIQELKIRYDKYVTLETVKYGLNLELANWNELKQDKEVFWFFLKRHKLIRDIPIQNINFKFSYFLE